MQIVINTFGASLRKQGEQFLIQARDKKVTLSAHKVQSILITSAVHLSTDAIQLAIAQNIDIVFLSKEGDPYGRVWQTKMGSTATIRRRQLEWADRPEGLALVREWLTAKLRQQEEFLRELRHRRPEAASLFDGPLAGIAAGRKRIEEVAGTLEEQRGTLMGLEGSAGRSYFGCLGQLVPTGYRFTTRSRRPARDEFNAMLNYGYGILYSHVERACIYAGLDPFLGFLHTDNYGKKSLVFDLIEPFRILAERTTVLLFTGRRVQKTYFEEVPGGVALNKEGRAFFIDQFNQRLEKKVRYPVQGQPGKSRNVKQRDVIRYEAHALANRLLGKADMPRIVETQELWREDAPAVADADELDDLPEEPADLPPGEEEPQC